MAKSHPLAQVGMLGEALALLRARIAVGIEYPDAHARAAIRCRVDGNELAAAYDAGDSCDGVHIFATTRDAYDATQCREDIANGDVIVALDEGVIGVADTWPVAVTEAHGELHTLKPGHEMPARLQAGAKRARELANLIGWA